MGLAKIGEIYNTFYKKKFLFFKIKALAGEVNPSFVIRWYDDVGKEFAVVKASYTAERKI